MVVGVSCSAKKNRLTLSPTALHENVQNFNSYFKYHAALNLISRRRICTRSDWECHCPANPRQGMLKWLFKKKGQKKREKGIQLKTSFTKFSCLHFFTFSSLLTLLILLYCMRKTVAETRGPFIFFTSWWWSAAEI